MSAYVPNPPFSKLLGGGHSGHPQGSSALSTRPPEDWRATSSASAAVRPQGTFLPTSPLQLPPHLTPDLLLKEGEEEEQPTH